MFSKKGMKIQIKWIFKLGKYHHETRNILNHEEMQTSKILNHKSIPSSNILSNEDIQNISMHVSLSEVKCLSANILNQEAIKSSNILDNQVIQASKI